MTAVNALKVHELTVRRGVREVLRQVSLEVRPGAVTTLLGPNGAGKSTLALALAGLLPVTSGQIDLGEVSLVARPADVIRGFGLATVPEGHRVLAQLTVSENLDVAGARLRAEEARAVKREVLSIFPELETLQRRRAGALSGGQQQMVALGQALMSRPQQLVIDELSLGLAPAVVRRLMPVITQIAESGVGVLLIEQFTTVALALADDAYVMVRGKIRLHEKTEILRARPELIEAAYHVGGGAGEAQ